jgi:hypothetical protein
VTARPAPAFVTLPAGFSSPRLAGGAVVFPLVDPAGVGLFELRAKAAGVVRLVFTAAAPGGEHQLRLQDTQAEHAFTFTGSTHVDVAVEVPRGVSQLVLKVDPAPASEADAVVISQPLAEPTARPAVLHAIPISTDPGF